MTSLDTAHSVIAARETSGLEVGPDPLAPAVVLGWGSAVPAARVTNDDLAARLDTSDEWITTRTGIRERRIAVDGETTLPLAHRAAAQAIERAGLRPADIDLVVVATATAELPMPSTGAQVAAALGTRAGAFDVDAACAGFPCALASVAALVATGVARTAVVVGADTMSRVVDPDDRGTAVLFGDGAAAVVLGASSGPAGLLASDLVVDGDGAPLLQIAAGGSRLPASAETVASGAHYLHMDGGELFRRVVREVVDSLGRVTARAGVDLADVAWFVPHQANARIVDAVVARSGLDPARVLGNGDRYGNTSAASIPLVLAEAAGQGRLRDGDLVILAGFGAGLTVATLLWRWGSGAAPLDSTLSAPEAPR